MIMTLRRFHAADSSSSRACFLLLVLFVYEPQVKPVVVAPPLPQPAPFELASKEGLLVPRDVPNPNIWNL
jgi:hypothetical protein